MKQKLKELKKETDNSTTIVGDIITPLSIIDRTTKQNINKNLTLLTYSWLTVQQTYTEYPSTPKQQDTYISQMHMEHFSE